jgi:membrane-associated phospholipid phosphatase
VTEALSAAGAADETGLGARTGPLLEVVDATLGGAFERLRGRQGADEAAAIVSNLSDYGMLWAVIALVKARRRGPRRTHALQALAAAGVLSFGVNKLLKAGMDRRRPTTHRPPGTIRLPVRPPNTSSFPSGHTLAAFAASTLLAESKTEAAAYVGLAGAVGVSRVHLGDHHPSDVVGGALIGTLIGLAARVVLRRPRGHSR